MQTSIQHTQVTWVCYCVESGAVLLAPSGLCLEQGTRVWSKTFSNSRYRPLFSCNKEATAATSHEFRLAKSGTDGASIDSFRAGGGSLSLQWVHVNVENRQLLCSAPKGKGALVPGIVFTKLHLQWMWEILRNLHCSRSKRMLQRQSLTQRRCVLISYLGINPLVTQCLVSIVSYL